MPGIHPIYTATTIIVGLLRERERCSATGFFFSDNEQNLYLVTNKHVIYGDEYYRNPEPQINQIRLNLHTDAGNLAQNEEVAFDLFDGNRRIWLEHTHPAVDIVVIPMTLDQGNYVFLSLDRSYLAPENIVVYFEKIFVMGYPYGWYDQVNNLPITRIGHLSSPFRAPFQGNPIMVGDVETHLGMSGGPVLMDLKHYMTQENGRIITHLGRRQFFLAGINSGQHRFPEIDVHPSLIVIWFPELILQIIGAREVSSEYG